MAKTALERVREVIAEALGIETSQIQPEHHITNDLGADSLDQVELCMYLEEEFDIEINDDDLVKWETVQDVVSYIEAL